MARPAAPFVLLFALWTVLTCAEALRKKDWTNQVSWEAGISSPTGIFAAGLAAQRGPDRVRAARVLRDLRKFFQDAAQDVVRRNTTSVGTACNTINDPWRDSVTLNLTEHRIGNVSELCLTSIFHSAATTRRAEALFREAATLFRDAVNGSAAVAGWNVTAMRDWRLDKREQRCVFQRAASIEKDGVWYILAAATDALVAAPLGAGERSLLHEYVSPVPGAPSMPFSINGSEFRTVRLRVRGTAPVAAWYEQPLEDNPALSAALRHNAEALDQARDASTPSNMAIIFIPLFMAFIPVALITSTGKLQAILYILFTDVLSTVPVFVKGFELLHTGTARNREAVSLFLGQGELKVVETWVANCAGREALRNQGLAFIGVGLFFLFVGFGLEFIAQRYMESRRRAGDYSSPLSQALIAVDANRIIARSSENNGRINYAADLPNPPPLSAGRGLLPVLGDATTRRRGRPQ